MKRLLSGVVIATLAYSGWWFYAAHALKSDVAAWFTSQQDAGWTAEYSGIAVRGFPSRTDLTLTNPKLVSPDGTFGWTAPFFQILGLSYKPGHVIVAWANEQIVTTPNGTVAVTSDKLRASVIHKNGTLLRSNLEVVTLNLAAPDRSVALAGLNGALQKLDGSMAQYRTALTIDSVATSDPRLTGSLAADSLASVRADITTTLGAPLELDTIATSHPVPSQITVHQTEVSYGALTFKMTGEAEFDGAGNATGEISFEADNWRQSLQTAQKNGGLPAAISDGVIDLLTMLSTLNGARDRLDITLGLNRGTVLLGLLPIGKLPPLSWR